MRRRKRAHFPYILLLCLVFMVLIGIRQRLAAGDIPFSLSGIIEKYTSGSAEAVSSPPETASPEAELPALKGPESETAEPPEAMDDCYAYYYNQLNEDQQSLYRQLYFGVSARKDSVTVDTSDADTAQNIYRFVLCDHPELFWCTGSSTSNVYARKIEFMPEYSCSAEEITRRTAEIEAQASACLSGLSDTDSDYEKVRHVYTWLINTVDYDEKASDNQNIYSSLVNHASVCAGYARGLQYLLNKLSLPVIYVTGTLASGGSHAWNLVNCNDSWYQTDVTFGDPVFANTEDVPQDDLRYAYLCCTDTQIRGSHIPDNDVSFPACSSMDLNYYDQNGWFIRTCDAAALADQINEAINNGENGFTLQCANSDIYRQVCDVLLNTVIPDASQTYMKKHQLRQVSYRYTQDSDMLIFALCWTAG